MKKKSKKNKKKIVIRKIITMIVLITIIAIIILLCVNNLNSKQTKAMETVSKYMSYINEKKYDEMYEMLASSSKKNITKENFIEKNEDIYNRLEASHVEVSDMKEEEENRKNKDSVQNKHGNNGGFIKVFQYYQT